MPGSLPGHPPFSGISTETSTNQWRKRVCCEPPDERRVNVYIRVDGRRNQQYALLFRDYLRAHPQMAAAYGGFKRRAAVVLDDAGTYTDRKDPVCDLVFHPAEEWAARTAWSP